MLKSEAVGAQVKSYSWTCQWVRESDGKLIVLNIKEHRRIAQGMLSKETSNIYFLNEIVNKTKKVSNK